MSSSRLASALLAAVLLTVAMTAGSAALASAPAYADKQMPNDDDGVSAGDVLGVLTNPATLGIATEVGTSVITSAASDGIADAATGAADTLAASMADGAIALLEEFATWWTSWTVIDLRDAGIDSPLALALGLSMLVAWLLLVVEAGRAAYTGDGTAIGNALVGLLKATAVLALLVPLMQGLLMAADELTDWIVTNSFGGMDGLEAKLTGLFTFDPILGIGLMFVFGLVGIILVLLLMFEFVLRHAGILIMICAAPLAAVGMLSRPTADWWPKAAKGLLTLVMLKPVVAFIFAIAFGILGDSDGVKSLIVAMAALIAAAVAWPVVASYFTFTSIGSGGTVGAAIAGGAAGWLGSRAAGGRGTSGSAALSGTQHSMAVEREADADRAGSRVTSPAKAAGVLGGARSLTAGAGTGASVGAGSAGAASTGAASAGVTGALVAATAAVNAARGSITSTSAGLTDMARHADLATPYPASSSHVPAGAGAPPGPHARRHRPESADEQLAGPSDLQPPDAQPPPLDVPPDVAPPDVPPLAPRPAPPRPDPVVSEEPAT